MIRFLGVIVSVNFYYESKSNTYLYFTIGWCLWVIAGLVALISGIATNYIVETLSLLMNYLLGPLAIFILGVGLSSYYLNISARKIQIVTIILIAIPLILNLLGQSILAIYARIFQFFGIIEMFLLPFIKYKTFKERIGKSIKWYYMTCFSIIIYIPLAILSMVTSLTSGSFQSENIIIIVAVYTSVIIMTILLISFIIHLEYTISNKQQNQLKDKYSHNLGNIIQVIYSSSDLFRRLYNIEDKNKEKLDLIEKKCKEASKLINEIRKL